MTKGNLERKGFIAFQIVVHHWRRSETQTGQEPEGRRSYRGHRGVLLTGLLLMAYSACLLIVPRTTSSWVAPLTMGWALPHQSLISNVPYRLAYDPSYEIIFLSFPPLRWLYLVPSWHKTISTLWKGQKSNSMWHKDYKPVWQLCGWKNYNTSIPQKQLTHEIVGQKSICQ